MRSTPDLPISSVFRPRPPLTIPPCDLPGNLGAKRDALAAVLATAAGVEPSAVALSIDGAAVSADITVPAEDADATRALLSEGLFARAKQFWVAAVQPVLPDGWFLMEQLNGGKISSTRAAPRSSTSLRHGCLTRSPRSVYEPGRLAIVPTTTIIRRRTRSWTPV